MQQLQSANYALGDRAELNRIWKERGYWYFPEALDKDAVSALKAEYLGELKKLGVVDVDQSEPMWNGTSLADFPSTFHSLHKRKVWQGFVEDVRIKQFFEKVLEDQVYWLPMDYYRVIAPNPTGGSDPFLGVHQDGMTNPGVEFVTCWMALSDIDEKTGGLALAEAQHQRGYMEVVDGKLAFASGKPLEQSWARADYKLGDVVIFPQTMPHFGMGNTSQQFRLSLDIRAVRRSTPIPVVGPLKKVGTNEVVIDSDQGEEVTLQLTDTTFLRGPDPEGYNPIPITREQVPSALAEGMVVMATRDAHDRALLMRPAMG